MQAFSRALCCNVQWSQNFWLLCSEFQCNTQSPESNGTFCTVMKSWALVQWPREVIRSPLLEIQTSNGEGTEYVYLYWPIFEQDSGPEISRGSVQPKWFCASMKLLSYPCSSQFLCCITQDMVWPKNLHGHNRMDGYAWWLPYWDITIHPRLKAAVLLVTCPCRDRDSFGDPQQNDDGTKL